MWLVFIESRRVVVAACEVIATCAQPRIDPECKHGVVYTLQAPPRGQPVFVEDGRYNAALLLAGNVVLLESKLNGSQSLKCQLYPECVLRAARGR